MDKILNRVKIILIIAIIIILIAIVIIFLFFKNETPAINVKLDENNQTDQSAENSNEIKFEENSETKKEIISDEVVKSQLILQARSFMERYGTYSFDSGFNNLKYLRSIVSQKLKEEV